MTPPFGIGVKKISVHEPALAQPQISPSSPFKNRQNLAFHWLWAGWRITRSGPSTESVQLQAPCSDFEFRCAEALSAKREFQRTAPAGNRKRFCAGIGGKGSRNFF
jgi:hypothetical protein